MESQHHSHMFLTERRASPRLEVLDQLHGHLVSLNVQLEMRDLGPGGFSTESVVPFPLGARHHFRLTTADDVEVLIEAIVIHRRPAYSADGLTHFIAGFAFVHDPVHDTAADICRLLDAIQFEEHVIP